MAAPSLAHGRRRLSPAAAGWRGSAASPARRCAPAGDPRHGLQGGLGAARPAPVRAWRGTHARVRPWEETVAATRFPPPAGHRQLPGLGHSRGRPGWRAGCLGFAPCSCCGWRPGVGRRGTRWGESCGCAEETLLRSSSVPLATQGDCKLDLRWSLTLPGYPPRGGLEDGTGRTAGRQRRAVFCAPPTAPPAPQDRLRVTGLASDHWGVGILAGSEFPMPSLVPLFLMPLLLARMPGRILSSDCYKSPGN